MKVCISLFRIKGLENLAVILALLANYKEELMNTGYFGAIEITHSEPDNPYVAMTLIPKHKLSWDNYVKEKQKALDEWFNDNLLKPDLLEVLHTYQTDLDVVVNGYGKPLPASLM